MFERIVVLASATLAAAAIAVGAIAQTPATPTPSTPAAASTTAARPAHKCVKPERLGRLATKGQVNAYDAESKSYRECMQSFANAQVELAKLHSEVANAAIKEYNDHVSEMSKPKTEAVK